MNDMQKRKIQQLREEGKSYAGIAALLGLSENTIKTYCKRHALGGNRAMRLSATGDAPVCKNCGVPVLQTPGRKKKIFCSTFCRNTWWNAHLDQVDRRAYYEYECPTCHKTFKAYANKGRKYCCHECYIIDRFGGDGHEKAAV